MKKLFLISTLFAAAAGTTFADENNVPANNENRVPAAEIAENSVPENAVPANAEAAAGTQNAADPAENAADEAALEIVARESADDAGTDEIDDSQTAKLLDEALENLDKNAATSGNVAADSAEISDSTGTDFTIFGHTFHVDPTKTHAPLVEPASSAPAGDKRVRLVLPAVSTKIATQTPAKTDDDDDGNSVAGTVAGTAILSAGTQNLTLSGTNSGIATRSFFSTASTSSTGTAVYSTSTVTVSNATAVADTTGTTTALFGPYLVPSTDSLIVVAKDDIKTQADFADELATTQTTTAAGNFTAIIKDGLGTLEITENLALNNSFVVREGTVEMKSSDGSALTLDINSTKLVESAPSLTVSGKNAQLILDNASYSMAVNAGGYQGCVVIAGQDGDGTLILENGSSLSTTQAIWAGTPSWNDENYDDVQTYYQAHVLGTLTDSTESTSYRNIENFASGEEIGGSFALGKATIQVIDSTLSAGTCFYVGNADILVSGEKAKISDNARNITATIGGETWINNFGSNLGTEGLANVTTTLKITDGAKAEFAHVVQLSSGYTGGNTTVTVEGTGSKFTSTNLVYLGLASTSGSGKVLFEIKDGASADIYVLSVGGNSSSWGLFTVEADSTYTGTSISVNYNGRVNNAGTMEITRSYVNDGEFINSGTITVTQAIYVNGVLENTGEIKGIAYICNDKYGTGTLRVTTENVSATAVVFDEGAILLLKENLLDGVSLDVGESTTLNIISSNAIYLDSTTQTISAGDDLTSTIESNYAQYDPAFDDYEKSWNYTGSVLQLTLTYIPEPSFFGLFAGTFALALAGTRRRRRSKKF